MTEPKLAQLRSSQSPDIVLQHPVNLKCLEFLDYLRSKPEDVLKKLYIYPTICLGVYYELPDIAKQFVMRILFVQQPVPQAVVASWVSKQYANELHEAVKCLTQLNVWRVTVIPGGLVAWELCATFKKNLKVCLLGGGRPWTMPASQGNSARPRDVTFLDQYAMSRWRCVLLYMVGLGTPKRSGMDNEVISPDAVRILLHANLMKRDETGLVITRQGFQFLLLETQAQVWFFMLQYLDTCEGRGLPLGDCLSLLFQLSFSTLGYDYSSIGMSPKMLTFLQHLREFGLVFQRKRKEGRFYPTRLAVNLTHKNAAMPIVYEDDKQKEYENGFIIVETNYRVYAYTESSLQIAILGLFTELIYRFPNLVVGVLTRESIRQALRGGITGDQIISYLEQYSHPKAKRKDTAILSKSPLPPTIIDQIKLWEGERKRFTFKEGVLYNQFLSLADYLTLREYADSCNALIWQSERLRSMIISQSSHDDVKKYWKKYSRNGI